MGAAHQNEAKNASTEVRVFGSVGGGVQAEMELKVRAPKGCSALALQVLREALADGQWHTAKTLAGMGVNDRELRVVMECHGEEFVSGNLGYRLVSAATVDETRHCAGRLLGQARKMEARALALLNAAHRRLHQMPNQQDL